jgi:lysophospholipase L1-like esterase
MGYAGQTAVLLGAAWRQVGFGATGLAHGGSGGALGALESFSFFHANCPRDNWQPDLVVINQGTNDGRMAADAYQPLYTQYLAMIRMAYPHAKIAAMRPLNGAQEASIRAAVTTCQTAGDKLMYYIDTTGWYSGALHPNADSCTKIAARLADALKTQVLSK